MIARRLAAKLEPCGKCSIDRHDVRDGPKVGNEEGWADLTSAGIPRTTVARLTDVLRCHLNSLQDSFVVQVHPARLYLYRQCELLESEPGSWKDSGNPETLRSRRIVDLNQMVNATQISAPDRMTPPSRGGGVNREYQRTSLVPGLLERRESREEACPPGQLQALSGIPEVYGRIM